MTNPNKHIAITIDGRHASCQPAAQGFPGVLGVCGIDVRVSKAPGQLATYDETTLPDRIERFGDHPAGCVPRLEVELRSRGYQVCIAIGRCCHSLLREHDREYYNQLTDEQRRHCDSIIRNRQFVCVATQRTALEYMQLYYPPVPEVADLCRHADTR